MIENVKVFFYMRAHNADAFVREAIESVLNQSEDNVCIMVHDNGSTDETGKICERIACGDKRIMFMHTDENESHRKAFARFLDILKKTDAKYFAFLDADDFYLPDFVEKVYGIAERECADVVSASFIRVDKESKVIGQCIRPNLVVSNHHMHYSDFGVLFDTFHSQCGKLYSRKVVDAFISANKKVPDCLRQAEDLLQNMGTLLSVKKFISLPIPLYAYRLNDTLQKEKYYSSYVPGSELMPEVLFDSCKVAAKSFGCYNFVTKHCLDVHFTEFVSLILGQIKNDREMSVKEKQKYIDIVINGKIFQQVFSRYYKLEKLLNTYLESDELLNGIYGGLLNGRTRKKRVLCGKIKSLLYYMLVTFSIKKKCKILL